MQKHITAVAALQIGLSIIGLLIGLFLLFFLSAIAAFSHDPNALVVLPTIGVILGGVFIVLSVAGIVGGIGLLRYRNWARILILILSVFDLFNIPIGTAVAIYTFWILVQDETSRLFGAPATPDVPAAPTPHPPTP
jgi:hypothetical protein